MKSKIALNIMVSVKGQYGLGLVAWIDMDLDEEQEAPNIMLSVKGQYGLGPGSVVRYGPG